MYQLWFLVLALTFFCVKGAVVEHRDTPSVTARHSQDQPRAGAVTPAPAVQKRDPEDPSEEQRPPSAMQASEERVEGYDWEPYQPLTITIVNRYHVPISTSHVHNWGFPDPIGGEKTPGLMQPRETDRLVVPTGWAGNFAFVDARYQPGPDDSLIEASFESVWGGEAFADVDVSFVNGFSLPAVCKCDRQKKLSGCGVNLWSENNCDGWNWNGACPNPSREDHDRALARPGDFFVPCQGQAYTFPGDDVANSFGECQRGHIVCCIGEDRLCEDEWRRLRPEHLRPEHAETVQTRPRPEHGEAVGLRPRPEHGDTVQTGLPDRLRPEHGEAVGLRLRPQHGEAVQTGLYDLITARPFRTASVQTARVLSTARPLGYARVLNTAKQFRQARMSSTRRGRSEPLQSRPPAS
ncbi:uncharacterized protein E0L32_012105 [Thyridium curvatum]|uniref:Thaumatin-like protein n=1 Tax=Thyridium curvatum TaxID=1093900 RepID=A0A507B3A9_9PEZI|nr:uncharacterized protein E0L32_012105 [Thyridium curvatum]TPX17595.1 hypothetical protein E0L32_012105 [Thyridium curvatum]